MTVELRPHFGWGDDDLKDMGGFLPVERTSEGAKKAWDKRGRKGDFDKEELTQANIDVWDKLSGAEKADIHTYANDTEQAQRLNRWLRTGELQGSGPDQGALNAGMRDDLDSAIQKWETPRDITVYRGVRYFTQMKPGMEFRDDGFVSTSVEPGVGFTGDIQLKIRVPKGTKAMPVNGESEFPNEEELLLGRGHKFRIVDIQVDPIPKPIYKPGTPAPLFAHRTATVELIE